MSFTHDHVIHDHSAAERRRWGARRTQRSGSARRLRLSGALCSLATLAVVAALLLVAALAAAGCGGGTSGGSGSSSTAATSSTAAAVASPGRSEVTLIMDWVPWVLDIPVDVAQQQGFYADHGLTVKQQVPSAATDVVKFVSTGKAQFGLYYAPDTLSAVAEGAPLLSVAALMGHAPVGMAMAPGQHASSPTDLEGKTAGVTMIPSTRASFQTMLTTAGVDPSSVKVADPGYAIVAPLLAGKYDAVAVTQFGELVEADAAGQKLDYLDFRDWGTPDYAFLNVITTQSFAADDPGTVRAFVAATTEGLNWAVAHPDEAVALYVKRHPELKSDLLLAQWKAAVPSMAASGEHAAGWQDTAAWSALNDWMVKSGQIKAPVDVGPVVSDSYLPAK
jgi:putative hydroxymethylpyrimidine transport system substrate-binding protein